MLTDNEGIQALNKEYRGKDSPTDVLSFPLHGPDEDIEIPRAGRRAWATSSYRSSALPSRPRR